jgi:DNA polymerase-3 subunit gamma/tau
VPAAPAKAPPANDRPAGRAPVDEARLAGAWQVYLDTVADPSRQSLLATLHKRRPRLEDGLTVVLDVDNEVQAADLRDERQALLDFLRRRLDNGLLQIRTNVPSPGERKDEAYTPAEKFRKMAERNPALDKLKKEFDLDF